MSTVFVQIQNIKQSEEETQISNYNDISLKRFIAFFITNRENEEFQQIFPHNRGSLPFKIRVSPFEVAFREASIYICLIIQWLH